MNCPNCGAAMKLYVKRGYLHCQHCGTFHWPDESPEGVRALGAEAPLTCTVCGTRMEVAHVTGEIVLHCPNCKGLLSRQKDFPAIVRRIRARSKADVPRELNKAELERQIPCPVCGRVMHTHPYAGPGNVVIDVCGYCQVVFLDHGELSAIRDAPGRRA